MLLVFIVQYIKLIDDLHIVNLYYIVRGSLVLYVIQNLKYFFFISVSPVCATVGPQTKCPVCVARVATKEDVAGGALCH